MTNYKYEGLTVLCNGCGQLMRDCGVWPLEWPKGSDKTEFCTMYSCQSCRTPSPSRESGYPVMAKIIHVGADDQL